MLITSDDAANDDDVRDAVEAKKAEALRKKAETAALLAEEEKALKGPKTGNAKSASKKTRDDGGSSKRRGTLDLAQLDENDDQQATPLKASGIDNALDALSLTTTPANGGQVDRHPERRYKAAYAAYEARRLPEIEAEHKGLRRQQRLEMVRKEFDKSPENPFNQVNARFDTSKDELNQIKSEERRKIEERLTSG